MIAYRNFIVAINRQLINYVLKIGCYVECKCMVLRKSLVSLHAYVELLFEYSTLLNILKGEIYFAVDM